MKTNIEQPTSNIERRILGRMGIMLAALALAAALPVRAADQVLNGRLLQQSAITGIVPVAPALALATNTTITSTAGVPVKLDNNVDLVLMPKVVCATTGTTNTTLGFDLAFDATHTNFSTTAPIVVVVTNSGAGTVQPYVIIPKASLVGATAIRFDELLVDHTNGWASVPAIAYKFLTP